MLILSDLLPAPAIIGGFPLLFDLRVPRYYTDDISYVAEVFSIYVAAAVAFTGYLVFLSSFFLGSAFAFFGGISMCSCF